MSNAAFYLPIAKVDRQKRLVFGYASTPTLDLDGEIVEADAIKKALPDYMQWCNVREMHQPSAVGVTKEANIDDKGLYIGAKIVDDDAWKKIVSGVYKGFSIGGDVTERDGRRITGVKLVEISLVDRPANPDCKIDVIKAAGMSETLEELALSALHTARAPMVARDSEEVGWLRRMVEKLSGGDRAKASEVPGYREPPRQRMAYADPGYQEDGHKRYPIDTAEHIRAAWSYIHRARDADMYSAQQLAEIKRRIVAAWRDEIDPKGPPETEKAALDDEVSADCTDSSNLIEDDAELRPERSPTHGDGFSAPAGARDKAATISRLAKSMSAANTLACVADMLECAENRLRAEGAAEGGDANDYAMADCLSTMRCDVLDVITAKAVHEKQEGEEVAGANESDRSVADILEGTKKMADSRLTKRAATGRHMDHLRKAAHHVTEAHHLLDKAARVTLGDKAADAREQAMEHLVLANHHIRAAGGERGPSPFEGDRGNFDRDDSKSEDVYEPESGIEGIGQREMTEGFVDDYEADRPYTGKTTKTRAISKREAEAIAEAAYLKGKVEAMEKIPASPKARLFALPRGAFPVGRDEEPTAKEKLLRGVNLDAQDASERQRAAGRMLGNMLSDPSTFARPVLGDPHFKGAAAR